MKGLKNFKVLLNDIGHTKIKLTKNALEKQSINYILKEIENLEYSEEELKESSDILCRIADRLRDDEEVNKYLSDNISYKSIDDIQVCIKNFFKKVLDNNFVDSASNSDKKRRKDYKQILKGLRLIAGILEEAKIKPIEVVGALEMIANLMGVCQSGWKATMVEILTRFEKKASKKCGIEEIQYNNDQMNKLLNEVFFNARICVIKKICFDYMKEKEIRVAYQPHYLEIFYNYLNKVYKMNIPETKVKDRLYDITEKIEIALDFQYYIWGKHINLNEMIFDKAVFLFQEKVKEIEYGINKDEDLPQYKNFFKMLTEWGGRYFEENNLSRELSDVSEFLTDYVMSEDITQIRNIAIKEIMRDYGYIIEKKSHFKVNDKYIVDRIKLLLNDIKSDEERENLREFLAKNKNNIKLVLNSALELGRYDILEYIDSQNSDKETKKVIEKVKNKIWFKAVKEGHIENIKEFINLGIDVDVKDADGNTALYIACKKENVKVLELLLEHDAKVNIKCEYKKTPLYMACYKKNDLIVEKLLEHNAQVLIGNISTVDYNINIDMLLYIVCERRYIDVLKQLAEKSLKERSIYLDTDIVINDVCERKDIEELKILLDAGARVNTPDIRVETPLHIACKNNDLEMVKVLIDAGADINREGEFLETPLYIACENAFLNIAKLLIDKGAKLNVKNERGASLLHVATYKNNYDIVKLLIDGGVNLKNKDSQLVLWRALHNKNIEIASLLIDNGVKAKSKSHEKILHDVCTNSNKEILDLLIKASVDVNAKDEFGYTPIYKAVVFNNTDIVKTLLDAKCDLNVKYGKERKTVFDMGNDEIKGLLEKNKGLQEVIYNKPNKIMKHIRSIV